MGVGYQDNFEATSKDESFSQVWVLHQWLDNLEQPNIIMEKKSK